MPGCVLPKRAMSTASRYSEYPTLSLRVAFSHCETPNAIHASSRSVHDVQRTFPEKPRGLDGKPPAEASRTAAAPMPATTRVYPYQAQRCQSLNIESVARKRNGKTRS